MGRTDRQQVGLLYHPKRVQDPIQVGSSLIGCSNKSELIFLPIIARRNRGASQEIGKGKGSESGNSRFLLLASPSTQKEQKVTCCKRPFLAKSFYTQTTFRNGDSQVGKTIDNVQWLGCLHRFDGCISSLSDTSNFQEVPAVRLRPPGISIHGLTIRNIPKSVCFHKANECHSNTFTSTCRISLSIPRQLADKRSDLQSTYLSHQIYSLNSTKFGLHSKSKEIRFDSSTTSHIYRYGVSNTAENGVPADRGRVHTGKDMLNSRTFQGLSYQFSRTMSL